MKLMRGLIIILVLVFNQCVGIINNNKPIQQKEIRQNIADTLKHFDKMGKSTSFFLNNYEAKYFNLRFQYEDFDFFDKKVFFFGPGGLGFSDKQKYFDELTRHTFVKSNLHIFSKYEKEKSQGFDAAIVYWSKRNYTTKDLVKKLKDRKIHNNQ